MAGVERMTGGEALARQLAREGVRLVFGVPGVHLDHLVDGLARLDGQIDFWNARNEQATSYLADGYARGGGDIGVYAVVPGPGLLNSGAGLATAYACSSRVLAIIGQVPSHEIGKERGLLHEVPNQSQILDSLTKWSALAHSPQELPGLVRRAVHELRSGRPRPVGLEVPMDVLAALAPVELADVPPDDWSPTLPDPSDVLSAARRLSRAARPAIVAGGGVLAAGASAALTRVAQALQAPVVTSRNGRGALPDTHPLTIGPLGLNPVLETADVVLVVGSRLTSVIGSSSRIPDGVELIAVNAEHHDLLDAHGPALAVLSDARVFLDALADELAGTTVTGRADGPATAAAIRQAIEHELAAFGPQMRYVSALRAAIPDEGVLVGELTQVSYVAEVAYPVRQPGTFILPGYEGTLGFGFPTALGVKAANPGRAVVSITGDGGFGWSLQELATARRFGIGVVTVVFTDGAYGNVRRSQVENFGGRTLGTDLDNPDFVALAEAFGITAARATGAESLTGTIREAITDGGPVVIEVPLEDCPNPHGLILRGIRMDPASLPTPAAR